MNKKGVIEELQAIIVPLIAIAIILVVGFLIFSEAKDKVIDITGISFTHLNESFSTYTTGTYKALGNSSNCMVLSCSEVRNGSPGHGAGGGMDALSTDIYNCSLAGLQINNATTDSLNSTLYVDYSCTDTTIAYNATSDIQNATQDIPGWLPIIVITVIGALLIGLVARFRS